jgi:hypothetical protein
MSDRPYAPGPPSVRPALADRRRASPAVQGALLLLFAGAIAAVVVLLYRATQPGPQQAVAGIGSWLMENPAQETANALQATVNALQLTAVVPTATATATATRAPTSTPGPMATINDCTRTPEPGRVCQVPPVPTATATPYPDCALMASLSPGDLCRWE